MCKELIEFKKIITDDFQRNRVAILMHENPDPDCIASSLGMVRILQTWHPEAKCTLIYSGEISHPQNKTLLNVLNIAMTSINEVENIEEDFDMIITVDVTPERCLKDGIEALLTVDHHRVETKRATIADIRQVGATSSIIWEYMQKENIEFKEGDDADSILATALLIGIKTDTSDFVSENVTDLDFEAYKHLIGFVNRRHLSAIINYPIPPYHFEIRSQLDQSENVRIDNGVFVGGVGHISPAKRDALPTMAEERARVEGIETAFVFAVVGDYIEVSVRSVGLAVDVNALCQKIFGKQYAGGKQGSGAAKIPLGFLAVNNGAPDDVKDKMWSAIKELMIDRIFHIVGGNA